MTLGKILNRLTALGITTLCLVALTPPAQAQRQFSEAKQALDRLWEDRRSATTPAARKEIATEMNTTSLRVQQLTIEGVISALNQSPPPSAHALEMSLRGFLDHSAVTEIHANGEDCYVVSFSVPTCAVCSRSWIGIVSQQASKFAVSASLENAQPDQNISVNALPNGGSAPLGLLVTAETWGDPHHTLTVYAYRLEQNSLRLFWSRSALLYGTATIRDNKLILTHTRELDPSSNVMTETYAIAVGRIEPFKPRTN